MKILYDDKINAAEAKRRLENARPNEDKTIWIEKKKGVLYLKLTRFRGGTTFKVEFAEENMALKYSGLDGVMSILLSILWCGSLCGGALVYLVLSFLTNSWEVEGILVVLGAVVLFFVFLWILFLKDRISAKEYVNKVLGLNVKK